MQKLNIKNTNNEYYVNLGEYTLAVITFNEHDSLYHVETIHRFALLKF